MTDLIARWLGIIMLRSGPEDLPGGPAVATVGVLAYIGVSALTLSVSERPGNPVLILTIAVIVPLVTARFILNLVGKPARWQQTVAALFGTSALLALPNFPLLLSTADPPPAGPVLLALAVFVWSFAVDAHIWRRALEVSFTTGLVVAVVLFAISFTLIANIVGIT